MLLCLYASPLLRSNNISNVFFREINNEHSSKEYYIYISLPRLSILMDQLQSELRVNRAFRRKMQ